MLITACDGNSTTAGTAYKEDGVTTLTAPVNEPAMLQFYADSAFGPGAVTVENHGVGGTTVLDSINGTNGFTPLGVRVAQSHARLWVGKWGINDPYRMTAAQFQSYLQTWVSTIQGNRNADGVFPVAVLEEDNPMYRSDAPNAGPYLAAMAAAAAATGVMLVQQHNFLYTNYPVQSWLPDLVHPYAESPLYAIMGLRCASAIVSIQSQLLGR